MAIEALQHILYDLNQVFGVKIGVKQFPETKSERWLLLPGARFCP